MAYYSVLKISAIPCTADSYFRLTITVLVVQIIFRNNVLLLNIILHNNLICLWLLSEIDSHMFLLLNFLHIEQYCTLMFNFYTYVKPTKQWFNFCDYNNAKMSFLNFFYNHLRSLSPIVSISQIYFKESRNKMLTSNFYFWSVEIHQF